MARIVTNYDATKLRGPCQYYAYNCLDTCITLGVFRELEPLLDEDTARVYAFERGMQNVAMTLQCRGICVDEKAAQAAIKDVERREKRCQQILDRVAEAWWDKGLNPRSPKQLQEFLYEVLRLPPQRSKEGKITTGIEALESLSKKAPKFGIIMRCILHARDLRKQLSFLKARRSPDGKIRASFNVGATETGRWSSSKNCFGEGLNYQNVYKPLRYVFVPSPGRKMGNADLEQAESRLVAHLSGDAEYIKAHEAFDTHTYVCKLIWPDAEWPGDEGVADVEFAKQKNFLRHFSRRDLGKRFQHLSNYGGTEYVVARIMRISQAEARDIGNRYFAAFPGIRKWQTRIKNELGRYGVLTTQLGRKRQFFDRVWDGGTQREAIANEPQSMVGDLLNVALFRVWLELDGKNLWLLHQGHDSFLFEFAPEDESRLLPRVKELMRVEFMPGEAIPVDVQSGANWLECCG